MAEKSQQRKPSLFTGIVLVQENVNDDNIRYGRLTPTWLVFFDGVCRTSIHGDVIDARAALKRFAAADARHTQERTGGR